MPDAQGNPSLTPLDIQYLREIDNNRLARWYMAKTWKENRKNAMLDSARLQEQNAQVQMKSQQAAAESQAQLDQQKLLAEKDLEEFKAIKQKEITLLTGLMTSIGKGVIDPQVIMPAIQQLVPNIQIPLIQENKQMANAMAIQEQQEIMQAEQQMNGGEMVDEEMIEEDTNIQ